MGKVNSTRMDSIQRYNRLIQRAAGKAVRPYREDGFVNLVNRFGTNKDIHEHYQFKPEPLYPDELFTQFYEGNGLFATIIDTPAEEAIKHGFTLSDVTDQPLIDFYTEALEELDWEETGMQAIKWARLFGGSLAVMLINDGRGIDEPLDWRHIKSIDDIVLYDRSVIQPDTTSMYRYDPRDPFGTRGKRLGSPEYFNIYSKHGTFTVHESRCLVFKNGVLPENTSYSTYELWGMPEYVRIHKEIRDAEIAHRSAPKFMEKSVQPVYKMQNLSQELATEQGEDFVLKRLETIDMARGAMNSIVIDADGEDYDFRQFQFNGVNDILAASCGLLSAVTRIPQTILFGQPVGGLSSTDDTAMENYYNYVERIQKRMLKSNLRYLLSVIFRAGVRTKEVDEVPKIKIEFNPLWSISDTEQADLDLKKAQIQQTKAATAATYLQAEVLDPSEIRRKLADSDEFDVETVLDEYDDPEELFPGEEINPETGIPFPKEEPAQPGMPGAEGAQTPEQAGGSAPTAEVGGTEKETDPGTEGSAPANAPAATKLPQDMSEEELQKLHTTPGKGANTDQDITTPSEVKAGSVGVIVAKDGAFLMAERKKGQSTGRYGGPGGHVEHGETPEQAAIRETQEEFGITPKNLLLLGYGPEEPETGLKPAVYLCTEFEGEPHPVDGEMGEGMWADMETIEEISDALFPPFADGLALLLRELNSTRDDGGPGSGNFGHEGRPGEVGGSGPAQRPAPGVESKKSTLTAEKRKSVSEKLNAIVNERAEIKRFQNSVNYKAKDYDPEPFKKSEARDRELAAEVEHNLADLPVGTLFTKGAALYEKVDDGTWTETTSERSSRISEKTVAYEFGARGEDVIYPPVEFIESSDDAKMVTDIKLKDDSTYSDWSKAMNTGERKDLVKRAKKDPEFKELVDAVVMYTEGAYVDQRKVAENLLKNGLNDASTETVGEMANGNLYNYRDLWKGQDLKTSTSSIAGGMAHMIETINHSEPHEGELFRVAQDRNIIKDKAENVWTPPKPGERIRMDAPTSFTDSREVESEISQGKMGDVIHYELESGAKALNAAPLSRYKQAEFLTCGEFEVVSVDLSTKRKPILREPTKGEMLRGVKEDEYGYKYVEMYEAKIKIRRVGDSEFAKREDSGVSYVDCSGHFDERMVLNNANPENNSENQQKSLDSGDNSATIKLQENTDYGVPGMKWGHRKMSPDSGRSGGGKGGRPLSDAEKKKYTDRLVGQKTSQGVAVTGIWDHAFGRQGERKMSIGRVEKMLQSSNVSPDKTHSDRKCYDIKGSRLVLNDKGEIVSVMWRKQNKG